MSLSYSDRYVLVVSLPFRGVSCSVPCFPLLNSAFSWKVSRRVAHFTGVLGPTSWLGLHLVPPERWEAFAINATSYDISSSFTHLRGVQCRSTVQWSYRDYGFSYDCVYCGAFRQCIGIR